MLRLFLPVPPGNAFTVEESGSGGEAKVVELAVHATAVDRVDEVFAVRAAVGFGAHLLNGRALALTESCSASETAVIVSAFQAAARTVDGLEEVGTVGPGTRGGALLRLDTNSLALAVAEPCSTSEARIVVLALFRSTLDGVLEIGTVSTRVRERANFRFLDRDRAAIVFAVPRSFGETKVVVLAFDRLSSLPAGERLVYRFAYGAARGLGAPIRQVSLLVIITDDAVAGTANGSGVSSKCGGDKSEDWDIDRKLHIDDCLSKFVFSLLLVCSFLEL